MRNLKIFDTYCCTMLLIIITKPTLCMLAGKIILVPGITWAYIINLAWCQVYQYSSLPYIEQA